MVYITCIGHSTCSVYSALKVEREHMKRYKEIDMKSIKKKKCNDVTSSGLSIALFISIHLRFGRTSRALLTFETLQFQSLLRRVNRLLFNSGNAQY